MSSTFDLSVLAKFFDGCVVTILAGPDKRPYHIHAAAFTTSESASLKALLSDRWDSAGSNVIDWSHTDLSTVERFCTYLYTGDFCLPDPVPVINAVTDHLDLSRRSTSYDPAQETRPRHEEPELIDENIVQDNGNQTEIEPTPIPDEEVPTQDEPEIHVEDALLDPADGEVEIDLNLQRVLFETFEARPLTPVSKCINFDAPLVRPSRRSTAFDLGTFPYTHHLFAEPMLALARLYCFAVYHLCPSLQVLTLQRMSHVLSYIDCSQKHAVPELVELAKYVYDNTNDNHGQVDQMRKIITQFTAINYTSLARDEFEHLLSEGGEFVSDLSQKLRRRLNAAEINERELWRKLREMQQDLQIVGACRKCSSRISRVVA